MTRPVTSAGSRCASSSSATGPSYSSPWLPPVSSAVGPSPLPDDGDRDHHRAPGRVVAGIGQPQEAVLHAVAVEIDGRRDRRRGADVGIVAQSFTNSLRGTLPGIPTPGLGDDDGFGDLQPHLSSQRPVMKWKVMPGCSTGPVAGAQAHGALAPVRRIATPDRIAGAAVLLDAVALQHGEEGLGDVLAGIAGLARPPAPRPCPPARPSRRRGMSCGGLPRKTVRDSGQ